MNKCMSTDIWCFCQFIPMWAINKDKKKLCISTYFTPGTSQVFNFFVVVEVQLDESVVFQLIEMGFPMEACKKAVFNTNNSGLESAMNWVMEHMEDPGERDYRIIIQSGLWYIELPWFKLKNDRENIVSGLNNLFMKCKKWP